MWWDKDVVSSVESHLIKDVRDSGFVQQRAGWRGGRLILNGSIVKHSTPWCVLVVARSLSLTAMRTGSIAATAAMCLTGSRAQKVAAHDAA